MTGTPSIVSTRVSIATLSRAKTVIREVSPRFRMLSLAAISAVGGIVSATTVSVYGWSVDKPRASVAVTVMG